MPTREKIYINGKKYMHWCRMVAIVTSQAITRL